MRGRVAGAEKVGRYAENLGDSFDPSAGDHLPLSNSSRADLQLSCDPLYGIAALKEFVEEGIAHTHFLSRARSQAQQQTKRAELREPWHTIAMTERDQKPRERKPKPAERNAKAVAIGVRLAIARKAKGLSQPELAVIMKLSYGAIGQYEAGISMPRPEKIQRLAEALDVTTEWLLTGNEPDEMVRAQTRDEQEALRLIRMIPAAEHATALAIWETLSRQKPRDTKK